MSENTELRLYCVMRTDLNLVAEGGTVPLGKLMAQAGHAFVGCLFKLNEAQIVEYMDSGTQPKIVLRVKNEKDLMRAALECEAVNIPFYLVKDAGRTVFAEPTFTCVGIGPIAKQNLPKFIQRLQLLEKMNDD